MSDFALCYSILRNFYHDVAKNKRYWLPIIFLAVLSYSFSTFHRFIGTDTLASSSIYMGKSNVMIAGMRWGLSLWSNLFSVIEYTPFIDKFLSVIFIIIGVTIINAIFYTITANKCGGGGYIIFASLVLTFPLINEIWEYNGAVLATAGNLVLVGLALLYQIIQSKISLKSIIISGIILSPVMSGYESGVFSYIALVMMILYMKYCLLDNTNNKSWLTEGLKFACPLVIALILRIVIGYALMKFYGIDHFARNGASGFAEWEKGLKMAVVSILGRNFYKYIYNGLFYFPIRVFVIMAILFVAHFVVLSIMKKTSRPIIIGLLLCFSLFLQPFIQAFAMPYRTAQTIQIFVGFTGYLLFLAVNKRRKIKYIFAALLLFLSFRQGVYLHKVSALSNLRSENEIAMIHNIGSRLYSEFDKDKPVIFAGGISIGNWIFDQVSAPTFNFKGWYFSGDVSVEDKQYIETNVNSYTQWARGAFVNKFNLQEQIRLMFSYCGYDLKFMTVTKEQTDNEEYEKIALANNMQPLEIRDMGNYILVYLGTSRWGLQTRLK